jgi:pSer/pThr/pTyr-binding forkhead associated (FHA) protein
VPSLDTESKKCSEDPKLSISTPTLNYSEPQWATLPSPEHHYSLEVIKEGQAIDQVDLTSPKKSFILIGRLASCDIHLEHVSISRHHCILQFGTSPDDAMPGWYIYDLGSTHGSFRNKQRVPARQFVRLHVGFVMKFGGSSRLFIVNGPEADQQEEAVRVERQELRKRKTQSEEEMDELEKRPGIARDEKEETKTGEREMEEKEETGINWGMDYGEDDVIDDAVGGEDFELGTMEEREKFYKEDPKKALNNWYEREGFELAYEFAEHGSTFNRKWRCTIELPVDLPTGQCLRSEAVAVNKKEAQVLCALDACRLLDRHGLLRRANNQARKQLKLLKENDFYDSDEDIFLDRTGQLERQREKRRKRIEVRVCNRRGGLMGICRKAGRPRPSPVRRTRCVGWRGNCARRERNSELEKANWPRSSPRIQVVRRTS